MVARLMACVAVLMCVGAAMGEPVFRAGAAMSNITPSINVPVVKRSKPPATNVHDDLHARCIVLDDGRVKQAFVVCDLKHMSAAIAADAKAIIEKTVGIPPERVCISATHTHSAAGNNSLDPDRPEDPYANYPAFVARRIADAVQRAGNQLEPARIGWGVAEEPLSVFNRRWYLKSGPVMGPYDQPEQVGTNPGYTGLLKPAGPTDPQISFISVQSTSGRPIGLLASYSLHYVGGVKEGDISADYFAVFADRIGQLLGADRQDPPFVGMMANCTSGDINNLERYPDDQKPATPAKKYVYYERMREVAYRCADKVLEAHRGIKFHDHVTLDSVQRTLTLDLRKPTPEMIAWAQQVKARKIKPQKVSPHTGASTILAWAAPDRPQTIDVVLQTHRVGGVAIAAMPFEVFVEIGLELKKRSPIQPMFGIELANGSHGYLPTPEQHQLGGYETWFGVNQVEFNASRKMTETLLEMLGELKARESSGR